MPNTRWTGGVVPTVDDNLIEAWDAYDDPLEGLCRRRP